MTTEMKHISPFAVLMSQKKSSLLIALLICC